MVRPLRVAIVCALVLVVSGTLRIVAGAAPGDKELAPVRGTVGYEPTVNAPFNRIFGRAVVPDNAIAVTQEASLGTLTLPDSSQVALGERTQVQVGAFNNGVAGPGSTLTIYHGAMRFAIVHPAGTRSNYIFNTTTSQIAVRGTVAYLITGDDGTQLICVDCAPGDVTITIGQRVVSLVSGFTITITGPPGFATFTISRNDQSYNPAVAQFLVILPKPDFPGVGGGTDPTGYFINGISHAGAGAWFIPVAVGGAIAGTIIANASHSPPPNTAPAPTPTPTPAYSALQVTPNVLTFNSVNGPPQTFTVQQTGPSGSITIGAPACNGDGAAASDSPASVPITPTSTAQTISVTALAAPTASPPPTYACSITVTGGNGQVATVNLNITSTAVGVHSGHRSTGTSAAPADTPPPAPTPPGRPPH
jgi:hypothetical protein